MPKRERFAPNGPWHSGFKAETTMTELPPATKMFLCKWKWKQIEPNQKPKKCHWPNRKAELNGFGGSGNDGRVATGA